MARIDSASQPLQTDRITWRRSFDTLPLKERSWLAVSGSDDATLRIYDYSRRNQIAKLLHSNRVYRLDASSDGKWIASCSQDKTIKLWNVERLADRTHSGYANWFSSLSLTNDGKFFAFRRNASTITICSANSSEERDIVFPEENAVVSSLKGFAFDTSDKFIAAAIGRNVHVANLQTDERTIFATSGRSWSVAFSPTRNELVAGSDNEVVVLDLGSKKRTTLWERPGSYFEETRFSKDGRYLACGAYFPKQAFPAHDGLNFARVWDLQSNGEPFFDLPYPGGIQCLSFSPDGRHLAISGLADVVAIFDLETRKEKRILKGNGSWLTSAEFSIDGSTLAAASPAGEIRFWRFPSGAPSGSMSVERGLRRIKFGGDGNSLIWSSMDGNVGFYRASPPNAIQQPPMKYSISGPAKKL